LSFTLRQNTYGLRVIENKEIRAFQLTNHGGTREYIK
jgi:hypothetical protein